MDQQPPKHDNLEWEATPEQQAAKLLGLVSWGVKERGDEVPGYHELPDGRVVRVKCTEDTGQLEVSMPDGNNGDDYRDYYKLDIHNEGNDGTLSRTSYTAEGTTEARVEVGFRSGELSGSFRSPKTMAPEDMNLDQIERVATGVLDEIEDALGAVAAMREAKTHQANDEINGFIEG